MVEVVVDLEKKTSRLTLKSFSNIKNLEKKIYYESQLGLSLKKRNRLFEIIEKDNSWSNRQEGLTFTNLYAHNTDWFMHNENIEFKELTENLKLAYQSLGIVQYKPTPSEKTAFKYIVFCCHLLASSPYNGENHKGQQNHQTNQNLNS